MLNYSNAIGFLSQDLLQKTGPVDIVTYTGDDNILTPIDPVKDFSPMEQLPVDNAANVAPGADNDALLLIAGIAVAAVVLTSGNKVGKSVSWPVATIVGGGLLWVISRKGTGTPQVTTKAAQNTKLITV